MMLTVHIRRAPGPSGLARFTVEQRESQTVLDVVTQIQREQDATLAYRFACRVGMCGSCAQPQSPISWATILTNIFPMV